MDTRSYLAIVYVHLDCTQCSPSSFGLFVLAVLGGNVVPVLLGLSETVSLKFGLGYNRLVSLLIDSFRPQQLEAIRDGRIYLAKSPVNQSSPNISSQHVLMWPCCEPKFITSVVFTLQKSSCHDRDWDELTFAKTSGTATGDRGTKLANNWPVCPQ